MFQDIGEYRNIIRCGRSEFADRVRMYDKAAIPGDRCSCFVQLTTFYLKSVSRIDLETPAFIAADIDQTARALSAVKGKIAIQSDPHAV